MNCDLMVQYIKFVADRLLVELECEKVIYIFFTFFFIFKPNIIYVLHYLEKNISKIEQSLLVVYSSIGVKTKYYLKIN